MTTMSARKCAATVLAVMAVFWGATGTAAQAGPAAPANQSTLEAEEARDLFGNWTMNLVTPDGTMPLAFTIGEQDGKVAVTFGGAEGQAITNISKVTNGFVVRSQIDYQGVNLPMLITVTKDGENLSTNWDFGEGAYVTTGTAVRQAS